MAAVAVILYQMNTKYRLDCTFECCSNISTKQFLIDTFYVHMVFEEEEEEEKSLKMKLEKVLKTRQNLTALQRKTQNARCICFSF